MGYVDDSLVDHNYTTATKTGYVTVAGAGDDAVYGDVNCDGEVTIADVVMLSRYVAEDTELNPVPSEQGLKNADCESNGNIDSGDITAIARYLAHLIEADQLGPQA